MNINIKPLKRYQNSQRGTSNSHTETPLTYCNPEDVKKLEADFKEAIETLFSFTSENAKLLESINVTLMDHQIAEHIHRIEIIEKATGQKWEDIK